MRKYILIAGLGLLIVTAAITIFWVLSYQERQGDQLKLSPEIVTASKEFKAQVGYRESQAKKLRPYLKTGMSKEQVKELLGEPDPGCASETHISYVLGYSQLLSIDFDQSGNLIRVEGVDDQYANATERTWPLIRPGRTKTYVTQRLGEADSESADGKTWRYMADGRTYTVIFDDKGLVKAVDPSHAELQREWTERTNCQERATPVRN